MIRAIDKIGVLDHKDGQEIKQGVHDGDIADSRPYKLCLGETALVPASRHNRHALERYRVSITDIVRNIRPRN